MEATQPPAQSPVNRSPESLRQRQRDRLSPRGRFAKSDPMSTSVREIEGMPRNGITLAPAPRPSRSPELAKKKLGKEGLRKENSVHRRMKREAEGENGKYDIAPDGGSAGREGRQFTVANVGNNGRIYLRPTIRPANQRYPQPSFVFPITPPSTAGLDAFVSQMDVDSTGRDEFWTPTRSPPTPMQPARDDYFKQASTPRQAGRHRRAFSHSTIDENQVPIRDSDVGAFRVVIERPGTEPKLDESSSGLPFLEIPIPSYRLGTPRFSMRGTAFLRGSSYTTTDDIRSSVFSHEAASRRTSNAHRSGRVLSRRHSDASPQPHYVTKPPLSPMNMSMQSPRIIRQRTAIVPAMFEDLTFKPACDHPSVVRYSVGGGIRAATPARLVAEITSPTFVDYDLLSDFFLTFRSFLDTRDLLMMLIARLKWAIARVDEIGTVVRVRTFVAIRHWVLNYFLDDFVIDYELRTSFCHLINEFVDELSNSTNTKVPLKILGELKKCWRRVCALYWDGPDFNTDLGPDIAICPGGIAGSRNPLLDPSFWQTHPQGPPQLDGIIEPDFIQPDISGADPEPRNYFADVSRAGHVDSILPSDPVPSEGRAEDQPPLSPTSIMSDDFVSCSFPSRARAMGNGQPLGAHPVPASSVYNSAPPVATTPKALTGKRVRPNHAHKRSGSFSDSFRDQRAQQPPVEKVMYKSTELLMALPYAGSLVRGNLFPPAQGFIEALVPSTPAETKGADAMFPLTAPRSKGPSAMSGPGMKKLLGSVRRVLSTRTGLSPNSSPTQGSFPHMPPLGVRGATINRLPGTAVVPQARPRHLGAKTPMRIDLLGAEVAEDFKRAVEEDAELERREHQNNTEQMSRRSSLHDPGLHYSTMRPETTIEPSENVLQNGPVSEVTNGSKSIVIVDDTMPLSLPVMSGALPPNPSVDTFADAFMQPSGGPTPPSTPPEAPMGIPRRSSQLLGHQKQPSISFDDTPSLEIDSRPSGEDERSPNYHPFRRPSLRSRGYSHGHKRSMSLRKYASYQSGFTRHRSERSFDATTFSDSEEIHLSQVDSIPLPLRVLRRRPGGDLRAVTNVGDLGPHQLRRPMSTGSFASYSDSVRSSYLLGGAESGEYVDVVSSDYDQSRPNENAFSLGALADAPLKPRMSLFSTHSSQPIMRPSFEKEAQYLAQIPDDLDDDGGVESALLKLEGKFDQRRSEISMEGMVKDLIESRNSFGVPNLNIVTHEEEEKKRHRQEHIVNTSFSANAPLVQAYRPVPVDRAMDEELKPAVYLPSGLEQQPAAWSPHSVDSYNSVPLLDRGFGDEGNGQRETRDWSQRSILRNSSPGQSDHYVQISELSHPNSYDFVTETESMKNISNLIKAVDDTEGQSFLDLENNYDDKSDLSSEMSLEVISRTDYAEHDLSTTQTFPPIHAGTIIKELPLSPQTMRSPPSPSLTMVQALMMSPSTLSGYEDYDQTRRHLPPTPQISPTAAHATTYGGERGASLSMDPLRSHLIPEASRKTSAHLPFILAFDSQVLAQQFTLIEKDALNEIDWKDLIEMRWKDSSNDSRSWVDFLRSSEPRGVEVVIARFNLMVKWAVSECVLTQDLDERVRCFQKYIHIAAHCRKQRNFATMTQLTVALTSNDLARLSDTWAHVPAADLQTLKELEQLVTPTSNFHNLRAEMEGSGAGQGCIPFVGIYTHDLLVNSERPSQFASTPTTEPLVNFERYRIDATIIKNLLRLLEASQLYRFLPIEGITERCLWMAALTDEDIARHGKMIQP